MSDDRDAKPGPACPLLAICAACGGAGASTLAYLIARSSTAQFERPVLLCDAGGPTGGLATYAGVQAPRSLVGVANLVGASELPPDGLFADDGTGLRILAGSPDFATEANPAGLERLLRDAREAHGLVVADCGTLRGAGERQVFDAASHVVWVFPASVSGVERASRVLGLFGLDSFRREVVVARPDGVRRTLPTQVLAHLAASRGAPLVLMPHVRDLAEGDPERALADVELTMEAIWTAIRK